MKHIEQIRLYLRERPFYRLFAIAESHLSSIVDSRLIEIDGFSLLRHDGKRYGGGLLCMFLSTIPKGKPGMS